MDRYPCQCCSFQTCIPQAGLLHANAPRTPLPRPWRGDTLVPAHNLREIDGMRDLCLEFGPNWVWVAPVAVFHSARWLQPKQIQIFKHKCLNSAACFFPSFLQYAMRVIFQASYKRYLINIEASSGGLPGWGLEDD